MDALLRWAAEMGVSDSPSPSTTTSSSCLGRSLAIVDFPDTGRTGLAAARDLRRGELVLHMPRAALFTSGRVMADDPKIDVSVDTRRPRLSSIQVSAFFRSSKMLITLQRGFGLGTSSLPTTAALRGR